MRLYLARHGEARAPGDGSPAVLTEQGVRDVERVAAWAAGRVTRVDQILHSGLERAEQTAEIFGRRLQPRNGIRAAPGLLPDDSVRDAALWLEHETRPLLFVSHLPFLDDLAGLLINGDPRQHAVHFTTGAVAHLEQDDGKWTLTWYLTPEGTTPGTEALD